MTVELSWFSPCTIHVRVESLKTFEMPPDEFGMRCKEGEREEGGEEPITYDNCIEGWIEDPKSRNRKRDCLDIRHAF